jgi:hypothetical protein
MNTQPPDATNVVAFQPNDIQTLLSDAPFLWWIAGGWALDLFMCEQTRPHFDVDVAIARRDQGVAQKHLSQWDFQYALRIDEKVVLRPWESGQILGREVHGVWGRQTTDAPWRFEFALHEIEEEVWTFRYFGTVQHPLQHIGARTSEGICYLKPEIALLYKAARMREVDVQDFHQVLPHLGREQRLQLAGDILRCWPEHPWLGLLK